MFLNPIRWKSQYYDTESGFYWIGWRWYDPLCGRFISSASPESILANAGTVFGLNMYALTLDNPVWLVFAACTCFAYTELYYNGEWTKWDWV